jgi:hypothetical protein
MLLRDIIVAIGAYAFVVATYVFLNRREFARSPEKRARYRALPLRYKLMCWFGVMPLVAGMLVPPFTCEGGWKALSGAFFPVAIVAFAFVEEACVRWYRKQGLL